MQQDSNKSIEQLQSRLARKGEYQYLKAIEDLKERAGQAEARGEEAREDVLSICRRLKDERDQLRAALEAVEWRASGAHFDCLWCNGNKRYGGHKPDCQRQAALGGEKQQ